MVPLYFAQLGSLTEMVTAPPEFDPEVELEVEADIPVVEVVVLEDVPEKLEPLDEPDDPELLENPELEPEPGEQVDPLSTYPEIQAVH